MIVYENYRQQKRLSFDNPSDINGRGGGIRTRDPLHPMQVRYQAAPRPDEAEMIPQIQLLCKNSFNFSNSWMASSISVVAILDASKE